MLKGHYTKVKETPLEAWINVHEGEPNALRKNIFGLSRNAEKAYEALMNDYIKTFGFSEEMEKIQAKKKRLAHLMMDYLQDAEKNIKILNKIYILRAELEKHNTSEQTRIIDLVSQLRVHKYIIDAKKTTVYEFENMVRNLKHASNG